MTRWLALAVLAAPLVITPPQWGASLAEAKNLGFLVLGAGAIIAFVQNAWLRAFVAWTVVAFFVAGGHAWALSGVLGVLAWAFFYQLARSLPPAAWPNLRLAIAASGLLQVVWVGVQLAQADPLFVPSMTQGGVLPTRLEPVGWFGNPMDLSLYLGLTLPLLGAVHPFFALAGAVTILACLKTTAGALAVAITGTWYAWRLGRAWWMRAGLVALLVAAVFGYLWFWDPQGAGMRPLIWRQMVHLIGLKPVLGWGPNAIDHRVILMTPVNALRWNFGFNEYLQAALELGLPALVCALGFIVTTAWRLVRRAPAGAELAPAFAFLVLVAAFSIPFRIGPVALVAALVLGQLDRRLA